MAVKQEYKVIIVVLISVVVVLFAVLAGLIFLDEYKRNQPTTTFETESLEIPFETIEVEDWQLFASEQPLTIQPGIKGIIEETYKVVKDPNGKETSREKTDEKTVQNVRNRVVRIGRLDREETYNEVRSLAEKTLNHLQEEEMDEIFTLLSSFDQKRFTQEELESIIEDTEFKITSYTFTQQTDFAYEDEIVRLTGKKVSSLEVEETNTTPSEDDTTPTVDVDVDETPSLIAKVPFEYVFTSSLTGSQKIEAQLLLIHEDKETWTVFYPGPTRFIELDRKRDGNDGGKNINYPLSFEITLNNLLVFHNIDTLYFSYDLKNTTIAGVDLNRALEIKAKELQALTQVPTDLTPAPTQVPVKLIADLEVSKAKLRDDPGTVYTLNDKNIYNKTWKTLPPDEEGKGFIKFIPAPSYDINNVILDVQFSIAGLFETDITFGTIPLE